MCVYPSLSRREWAMGSTEPRRAQEGFGVAGVAGLGPGGDRGSWVGGGGPRMRGGGNRREVGG